MHQQFTSAFHKITQGDITVIMTYLNAKLPRDNTNLENIMGKHGTGAMKNNRELLTNFCANNFVVGVTLFPHKSIHKITSFPDMRTENQIDHVIIASK